MKSLSIYPTIDIFELITAPGGKRLVTLLDVRPHSVLSQSLPLGKRYVCPQHGEKLTNPTVPRFFFCFVLFWYCIFRKSSPLMKPSDSIPLSLSRSFKYRFVYLLRSGHCAHVPISGQTFSLAGCLFY